MTSVCFELEKELVVIFIEGILLNMDSFKCLIDSVEPFPIKRGRILCRLKIST